MTNPRKQQEAEETNAPPDNDAPSEASQEARQEAVQATGADAAVGAVRPRESQIRGSFMPGGGAGEDATTYVDPDTHANIPTTATAEEREALVQKAREAAQKQYDDDVANPEVTMVTIPAGVTVDPGKFDS